MAAALTITGNANDALAAIAALERKYDSLEGKIRRTGSATKESGWETSLDSVVTKYAGIATVIGTVSTAVTGVIAKNAEYLAQLDAIVAKNAQTEIKTRIQAGMTAPELKAMMPGMERALVATPAADMDTAMKLQTQIASSGFKDADVKSGAALQAVLNLKAATNQFGEGIGDEGAAAGTMSKLLKGGGIARPSAADLEGVGASIVSVFEKSDVQMPHFEQLAPKMASLTNFGLSMNEAIGTFSSLVDVSNPEKAATGLQAFVTRTATAANSKEKTEALSELGLKPEDVAMAKGGKGLFETVDLMRAKLGEKSEEDRNRLIAKIYGEEGQAAASRLLSPEGTALAKDFTQAAGNKVPMARNLKAFQESRYARNKATEIAGEFALLAQDTGKTWQEADAERATDLRQQNRGKGWGGRLINTFGDFVEAAATKPARWMGATPDEVGLGGNDVQNRIAERSMNKPEDAGAKAVVGKLEELIDVTKAEKKRPLNPNGNVER
jgi:hypothetical protein